MTPITAETITDDQIQELRKGYLADRNITGVDTCDVALGRHGASRNPKRVARARARCAEILNKRSQAHAQAHAKKKTPAQLDAEIAEALAGSAGSTDPQSRVKDLYEIAEEIRAKIPRYGRTYFEDGHDESLWFDTYPAKLYVMPHRSGRRLKKGETIADATSFDVGFSWQEAEVEMGSYKTARAAIKRAMDLALWGEDDIREAFGKNPYAP